MAIKDEMRDLVDKQVDCLKNKKGIALIKKIMYTL